MANCSFVKCPGNTASVLYKQYIKDLNDLPDQRAPEVSHTIIKGPVNGSQILICCQKLSGATSNTYGARINHHKIELDCVSRLPVVIR